MGQSQLWSGSSQPMLGQIGVPGTENAAHDINENHIWGTSPWLQQPLQQQASRLEPSMKAIQNPPASKVQLQGEMLHGQFEQCEQETEADDADDVDSEIYERAVRFIEELSTEESDSEDQPPPIKEPMFDHGAAAGMWNSQEAWPMWNVEFTGAAGGMWNPKLLDNAVC